MSLSLKILSLSQNNPQSNDSVKIPVYDEVYASAGQGFIDDEHILRHRELDKGFLRLYFKLTSFLDLSIITVRRDSMLPAVPETAKLSCKKAHQEKNKYVLLAKIFSHFDFTNIHQTPAHVHFSQHPPPPHFDFM